MQEGLMTVSEAARAKGVSPATLYAAVSSARLAHTIVLGRIAISRADLEAYTPTGYRGRPGAKGRGGRPAGKAMDAQARSNISQGQKKRWDARKSE